jgi:hypothetical protein
VVVARASVRRLSELEKRLGPATPPAHVAFEACREGWHVHDVLHSWGKEPVMLDTTRVRQIGVGQHGRKNDALDADGLPRVVHRTSAPDLVVREDATTAHATADGLTARGSSLLVGPHGSDGRTAGRLCRGTDDVAHAVVAQKCSHPSTRGCPERCAVENGRSAPGSCVRYGGPLAANQPDASTSSIRVRAGEGRPTLDFMLTAWTTPGRP